jgi:hypothetical protein
LKDIPWVSTKEILFNLHLSDFIPIVRHIKIQSVKFIKWS